MMERNRNTILIVDDMVSNRIFLRNIFKEDYELIEACNGEQALQQLKRYHGKIAAMLLDVMMPVKDGFQTLEEMAALRYLDEFPVLIVTSDADSKNEARLLRLGASDMIHKPYDPTVIKLRVSNLAELFADRRMMASRADDLEKVLNDSSIGIVSMLAAVTEFRSLESGQHTLRIKSFAEILMHAVTKRFPEYELEQREIDLIANASILHDVGKIMIPDSILDKPGRLTAEEFEIMKTHTIAGCKILDKMPNVVDSKFMQYAYNISRYHHERWDGRGYSEGLKQNNIPLCAQVVGICDVYDALTTPRVYKDAFSHEKAVSMILNGECGVFNPELLECFRMVLPEFEECAREYADGVTNPKVDDLQPPAQALSSSVFNMHKESLVTAKYHALLQMINGIVIEIDMNEGTFHLVYDTNGDFDILRLGGNFNEVSLKLLNTVVHPDDKLMITERILSLQKEFFEAGLQRQSRRYRVRSSPTDAYFWIEATCLRINTGRPNDKKLLCICKKVDEQKKNTRGMASRQLSSDRLMRKLPLMRCRQDRWMTIVEGWEGLSQLLGFSLAELKDIYQNRLLNLICLEDRERVCNYWWKTFEYTSFGEIQYRLHHKNGSCVWVVDKSRVELDSDGEKYVYRVLLDNTETCQKLYDTRLKLERQQLLLNNASEIFFEWDLIKDEAYFTENFRDTFGYSIGGSNFGQMSSDINRIIYVDDIPLLKKLISEIMNGKSFVEQELRFMKADGTYLWCRVRGVGQQWENGKIVSLLGTITNINSDKMVMQNLQNMSERDVLTGLSNRYAATKRIEQYLQGEGNLHQSALLMLDIDNFKRVNDTYGHVAGDSILISCGEVIRKQFRNQDVIARIGGDEFQIWIRNIPNEKVAQKCSQKVIESFKKNVSSMVPDCDISCSIGIAVYPQDGQDLKKLFQNADMALLYAKEHGKHQYATFSEIGKNRTVYQSVRTEIESNGHTNFSNQGLFEYTMHHLYRSENFDDTIQNVLEMVGRQAYVSRAYIFEYSKDKKYCNNTFEWCNDGVSSVKERQQKIEYDTVFRPLELHYENSNIFSCCDIETLPDEVIKFLKANQTKSFLHCAIKSNGKIRGFVGFNDCNIARLWTVEQISVLESFAEILSLFLFKKRDLQNVGKLASGLLQALNHSNNWIYLVDGDTYETLFFNNRVRKVFPQLKLGEPCYTAIMQQDSPCEQCPIKELKKGKTKPTQVINNCLHKCVMAKAQKLYWNGKNAMLIICEDSDQYPLLEDHR